MFFLVGGVTKLPAIRVGVSGDRFFLDVYPESEVACKSVNEIEIEMPEGFTITECSVTENVITVLCQAPSLINTVDDLLAAEGEVVITFCT